MAEERTDAEPPRPDKRDRENGMFSDPVVEERTLKRQSELQRKLTAISEEGRLQEIYEFIIKHRPGKPVRPHRTIRGSYNAIFRLEYTDGSAILRVALPGENAFPDEKVRAEVATMRYVEKMTSVPVPRIYHWGTAAENPLGLGAFIIMDYIPHDKSLSEVLGDPTVDDPLRQYLDRAVPEDKLERLYGQVARVVLELSRLEMPRIGSLRLLVDGKDGFTVGGRPLTQDMNELVVRGGVPPSVLPPEAATYSTALAWYEALADLHVAHLAFQRNSAVVSADDCRDKFVARHLFRQLTRRGELPPLPPPEKGRRRQRQGRPRETFRLWVDDLRPHNILVDADLNVVGVIDWEWAYFAPEPFVHDPPWWLLLGRPEYWRGSVLDWRDEFAGVLDLFCRALRRAEDAEEKKKEEEEEEKSEEWSISEHLDALSLSPGDAAAKAGEAPNTHLSSRMRASWESGALWANYAARRNYGFDAVFWEFLDERFFGKNTEGGWEGRASKLSGRARRRMELFVDRKMKESKEEKIQDWDPEEAQSYLAEILSDLD